MIPCIVLHIDQWP